MKPAIFLDRDGTIIEDQNYPKDPNQVAWTPFAVEGLKEMTKKGYVLFVVSNQSGVGRGIIQDSEFRAVHERFCELLKKEKIEIQEFAYCFHKPEDECECRKPAPTLSLEMAKAFEIDLKRSFCVGDKVSDVELGQAIGAEGVLVLTGKGNESQKALCEHAPKTFANLFEFAKTLP